MNQENMNKEELEKAIHSCANDIRRYVEDLEDLAIILGRIDEPPITLDEYKAWDERIEKDAEERIDLLKRIEQIEGTIGAIRGRS